MKNKILILPLLLLALVGMVYAGTCTVNAPGASAVISGDSVFNISSTVNNTANCTITGSSALSGGSFTAYAMNYTGAPRNQSNVTITTSAQRDAADWSFDITCYNTTAVNQVTDTCSRTGITINNTIPIIDTCLIGGTTASTRTVSSSGTTFACTIYNATSANVFWRNAAGMSADDSSSSNTQCTNVAFSNSYGATGLQLSCNIYSINDASNTLYFNILDGADTVTGTSYTLSLEGTFNPGDPGQPDQTIITTITNALQNKMLVTFVIIVVVVLLFLVMGYYMVKKK